MGKRGAPGPATRHEAISAIKDSAIGLMTGLLAKMILTPNAFAKLLGTSGLYEMEAAEVALRRSGREDVKQFARQMMIDHSDLTSKLGSFLGGMNAPESPPQSLDSLHQILLDDLNGASDRDFDKRYLAQQKGEHNTAINLLSNYMERGANEGLRNLAALALPVVKKHMEMLQSLSGPH